MRKLIIFCLLSVLTIIAGCETTKGAGKDVENTGQNIQEGIDNIERKY